jgi:outer membrane lipoprotein-sorting protein
MNITKIKNSLFIFLIAFGALVLPGCWESDAENAAEDVIEKTKEIGEDAKDKMDDAASNVGDKIREAGEKLK